MIGTYVAAAQLTMLLHRHFDLSHPMRRFLIVLTLVLLLAVSISVGVLVAEWPEWGRVGGPGGLSTVPGADKSLK